MSPDEARLARANDHDPFDVFRAEVAAYRLVPLIYSAGRDEEYGIFVEPEYVAWRKNTGPSINVNGPQYVTPRLTPYDNSVNTLRAPFHLGTALDETATDNVHNHLLGLK
jgi:hypothetical protein